MSVSLSPIFNGWQGFTSSGIPLNAGLLNTYAAGGTTPQPTFTTSAGNVQNANPIVFNADGRPPNEIWLTDGISYRFDLTDSLGNLIKTYDNISASSSFTQSGTGAASIQITTKLREYVCFDDYTGTDPTGTTASDAGFQAAINFAVKNSCKVIGSPGAVYKITTPITIPFNTSLIGGSFFLDIDLCGAAIYPVGIAGSVFKATNAAVDYQSSGHIHDGVVWSTNTDSAVQTALQAYAFLELAGGGFINWRVSRIKSRGAVCIGAVMWFSELDNNSGYPDGCSAEDINFGYAAQTAHVVAATRLSGYTATIRELPHFRMLNCFNATNSNAVDFRSWESSTTRGTGNQCALWLDGIALKDSHIGPWVISNPQVIKGVNNAFIEGGTIETIYSELSASTTVFGASGLPVSISCESRNVEVINPRLYFDYISFAGSARIFKGKAINCKFLTPKINQIGGAIVATDKYIELTTGSIMNYVDAFDLASVVGGVETTSWYPHPSQHVTTVANGTRYNDFRKLDAASIATAVGTVFASTGDKTLATIPAYCLNAKDQIIVKANFTSDNATGAAISIKGLINGQVAAAGAGTVKTTNGPDAACELIMYFTAGTDKTYAAGATSTVAYTGSITIGSGTTINTIFNSGITAAVDYVNNDMTIVVNISSITGNLTFNGLWIDHKPGKFSS